MRINRIILLSVAVIFLCGCFKKKFLILNPQFSVNLAVPTDNWPAESKLTPAQKAIFEQLGKPDYIRIWWDKEGRLKSYLNVDRAIEKKLYREAKQSWVYIRMEKEIVFINENGYTTLPLSDKLKVLCKYGDPESVKIDENKETGEKIEIWQYYSEGKIFKFLDEKLIKEQTLPRVGTKIKT